jgi:DNA-binding NarL/FixJ family response regulator
MLSAPEGYPRSMTDTHDPRPLRVALAHESELVTQGLGRLLADHRQRVVLVPPRSNGGVTPVVDLTLHDSMADPPASLDAVTRLLHRAGGGRLVTFTWNVRPDLVRRVLDLGVSGCLSKDLPAGRLVSALEAIDAGETVVDAGRPASAGPVVDPLTPREAEVITLITMGLDNNSVARETYLSINSVKSHIRSAYRKMGVTSRSQAVLWGIRHGYADPGLAVPEAGAPALTG